MSDKITWNQIPGYFTFPTTYDRAVELAKNGDNFIEIGAYLGRSTAYMVQKIRESGKQINLFTIDPWTSESLEKCCMKCDVDDLFSQFQDYMKKAGAWDDIVPIRKTAEEACKDFIGLRFKFIFVDGSHLEEDVRTDILKYFPLLTDDGWMAGDDYNGAGGVKAAVDSVFPKERIKFIGPSNYPSWYVDAYSL